MAITLNYLAMAVRDLERTLAFYRDLGLPVPHGAHLDDQGQPAAHVEVRVGTLRVAWQTEDLARQANPAWQPSVGPGRVSVALEASSPGEVDEVCARMAAQGHTVDNLPYDAFWGQRYAALRDPDGNHVDVFAWQ